MFLPRKIINGRFRETLGQPDIRFVVTSLTTDGAQADGLLKLLTDPVSRNSILDSPVLRDAAQKLPLPLKISHELFFYILLRQGLPAVGIKSHKVASFLAEALASFPPKPRPGVHTSDYVEALKNARDYEYFALNVELGNRAMILSSVYAETIYKPRKVYKVAGLNFYENLGRACYRNAASHQLAEEFELKEILNTLAAEFVNVRTGLGNIKDGYLRVVGGK
jgi:hypothetical protein